MSEGDGWKSLLLLYSRMPDGRRSWGRLKQRGAEPAAVGLRACKREVQA